MRVSIDELKENTDRFVAMASSQEIFITQNGKVVAKLVPVKTDKVRAAEELFSIFTTAPNVDLDKIREERILRYEDRTACQE